ncbi:MAG: DUF3857 domain-containing protein [Opitutaceae bacterium]
MVRHGVQVRAVLGHLCSGQSAKLPLATGGMSMVVAVVRHRGRKLAVGWIMLLLTLHWVISATASESQEIFDFPSGPIPDWVEPQSAAVASSPVKGHPANLLLNDSQSRLTRDSSDYFRRTVVRLLNAEGVSQNSEWSVTFSPDFEKITWHKLTITRGDEEIDRLPATKFKRLQRELGFESKVYSGEITAVAVLEDVRVGDIIDVAYTLHRANPIMNGHVTARHYLGSAYPIKRQNIIVRTPEDMPELTWSYFVPSGVKNMPRELFSLASLRLALESGTIAGERVYRWSAEDVPGVIFDSNIAARTWPYYPMIRCGSFKTWADVVEWAEPLFSGNGPLPGTARVMTDRWKQTLATPGERVRAAVQWAQNDIRYFAMAIGDHNVRPRALDEVCATRFGDCKDKSTLLVAMLRELGIEAWPVLVNTFWRERIGEYGPGPFAFNHAIVVYKLDNETHWIDPTIKLQKQDADGWALPAYRFGLILREGESALTPIPDRGLQTPDVETADVIVVDPSTREASLTSTLTFRGLQADYYRQILEATTTDKLSSNLFNYIARFYNQLEEEQPPEITDAGEDNVIVVTARYTLPDFSKKTETGQTVEVYAYALRTLLDSPETRRRRWPYALPGDRFVRHRIEMELPFDVAPAQDAQVIVAEGMEYRLEKGLDGKRYSAVHDLKFTRDYVPAEQMGVFSDAVAEVLTTVGLVLGSTPQE